jgi:SPP1 gp7 family putative phage head morphogenesis protein
MGERSVLDYEKLLTDAYSVALSEITKQIYAFYQKYAADNKITYAEARKRLTALEVKEFRALLKKWYEAAVSAGVSDKHLKELKKLENQVYIARLESLETSIKQEIEILKANQHKSMTELLSINYLAAHYISNYDTIQGMEVAVNFAKVDRLGVETAIKTRWNKRNYSDSIWTDKDKLISTLEKVIPQSFSRGLRSDKLGDMIAKELNTSKNRSRALARTEVNYISNQADLEVYKLIGIDSYEYLATLDMRTSEICRSMDGFIGKVSQVEVGINYPPLHPNCRSTTIPHFEDEDVVERVARNQQGETITVPRRMNQEEWINKYAPEEDREKLLKFIKKYGKTT